jgi:hypothetical protein
MPFKKQTPSSRGDKSKSHSDLSHHYGEIGIKAVAAVTRKGNESTNRNPKRKEKAQNDDENEE